MFFDGSCPLCRAEIGMYENSAPEGALRFVDISEPATALPPDLDREKAMARFHVIGQDGRMLSGAAAFVALWRHLPGWRRVAGIASLPGMTPLLECGYRLFLHTRPGLVRLFVAARRLRPAR